MNDPFRVAKSGCCGLRSTPSQLLLQKQRCRRGTLAVVPAEKKQKIFGARRVVHEMHCGIRKEGVKALSLFLARLRAAATSSRPLPSARPPRDPSTKSKGLP